MDQVLSLTNNILDTETLLFADEDEEYTDDDQDDEDDELLDGVDDDDPGIEWRNDGEFEE